MPAIIPQYRQQTRASGGAGIPTENPNVLASGFHAIARELDERKQRLDRLKEEDAAAWAAENLSKTQQDWNAEFLKRKEAAEEGAPDFTESLLKDYDAHAEKLIAQAPTKASRLYTQQRLDAYRTAVQGDAMVFEATSKADHAVRTVDQATDRKRQVVQVSPHLFESMYGEQAALIDGMRLPAARKEVLKTQAKEGLAHDAVYGLIQKDPYGAKKALGQEPGKSGVASVEALSADDRLRLTNAADAEINRREAEKRARMVEAKNGLIESRNDALAAKAAGLPANLPSKALYVGIYGAEEGGQRFRQDSQLMATFDAASAAVMLPPSEGVQQMMQFAPTQQEGAADQAKVQQQALALYGAQRKAFEADPALGVVRQDPDLQESLALIDEGKASPADISGYVSKVRSKQQAAGILKPKLLPTDYAARLSASLAFNPEKPGQRAQRLAGVKEQWGSAFPQVLREVMPNLEGDARVMVSMRTEIAKQYDQALATKDQVKTLVPSSDQTVIKEKVNASLEGLAGTLLYDADGQARAAEIQAATQLLALSYAANGTSPAEAAEQAANVVVNERYEYRDSLRIPLNVDADVIENGTRVLQRDLPDLQVTPLPGDTPGNAQADLKAYVQREGYWVTVDGDSGAELRVPYQGGSVPVLRADGTRMRYGWKDIAARQEPEVPEYLRKGLPK